MRYVDAVFFCINAVDLPSGNAAVASAVAGLSIFITAIGVAALFCAIAGMVKNTRIAVSKSFFIAGFLSDLWFNVYI
jgi:hypothetical protein